MMGTNQRRSFFASLFIIISLIAVVVIAAEVPPDGIVLKCKKGEILLNHSTHANIPCTDCHHPVEGVEEIDYRCHNCHTQESKDSLTTKKAFHKNCRDCHKKLEIESVPKKCKECHKDPEKEK